MDKIDIDFGEPFMSYKEENMTSLEDVIKYECIENGCYVGVEDDSSLKSIADEFLHDAEKKEHLRDYLINEVDLMNELSDAIVYMNYSLLPGIIERLKRKSTENLKEEIELIAARLI